MKIPFKHYLHGHKEDDFACELNVEHDLNLSQEQLRELTNSFYEVTLECEYDTETNQVTLIKATL